MPSWWRQQVRPGPAAASDYVELLPAAWRTINAYGVKIGNRTYDGKALTPYRRQHSGVNARNGLWEIHHDPHDVTARLVRTRRRRLDPGPLDSPANGPGAFWRAGMGPGPEVLARRGQDPVTEAEIARAAAALLDKAEQGPARGKEERRDRKAAARARAAATAGPSVPEEAARPPGRRVPRHG